MQASIFNLRVPLDGDNVFLMNTLTDAQIIVSPDVAAVLDQGGDSSDLEAEAADAFRLLEENGFLVPGRDHDRQALNDYLTGVKSDRSELNVTVLTTLQCNFACDYCYQGDHGDHNLSADRMSLETAGRIATWIEREMDRVKPERFVLTFFGGEPLLNLPVLYLLAERLWKASEQRHLPQAVTIITNGLLLTEAIVDRLLPFGLRGVKITLDGDKDTHNRMRPLRGGQGTFDRIVENMRRISGRCRIAIGGNFDESSAGSFPALLAFLREQDFADQLVKVNFKPVVRAAASAAVGTAVSGTVGPAGGQRSSQMASSGESRATTFLRLTPVGADGSALKPLNGTCMTSAGAGIGATCDACEFLDDEMAFLREETRRYGFPTPDGVHNGPCHVHHAHAHTIGPDGSLYACPGFTGAQGLSTGHVDDRLDPLRSAAQQQFDRLSPWNSCGDCAFIPVCAGGCVAASHATLGDMNTPACHKRAFESAVISLAHQVAGPSQESLQ